MLHMNQQVLAWSTRSVLEALLLGCIPRERSPRCVHQDFVFLGYRFRSDLGFVMSLMVGMEFSSLNLLTDVEPLGLLHIRPLQIVLVCLH